MIPYGRQNIDQNDIDAVLVVLKSDWITQGPVIEQFEKAVAGYSGAAHGVAVNSATSALHVACLALGLGPADRLWTSPNTFVASANCALFCGAQVDFVDIDPLTCNMSVGALELKLRKAEKAGKLPKILVPVHFSGQSCDMRAIGALSQRYGFRVIEDASHAIGGKYLGDPIGNCRYSSITVFSFHPVKLITTGEGGMALTNDTALAERMSRLRSHGITREPSMMPLEPDGRWHYQQIDLGYNFRMTDIQAALGLSQLARLDEFVQHRHEIAADYDRLLSGLPVRLLQRAPDCYSAYHLYVIRLESGADGRLRRKVYDHMYNAGIGVNVHYIPVHIQPYYQALGFRPGDFPEAEKHYAEALTLPMFPGLTDVEQGYVASKLGEAIL